MADANTFGGSADPYGLNRFVQAQEDDYELALSEIQSGRKRSHPRLLACAEAAIGIKAQHASEVFGSPNDMKLRSCATLFACVSPAGSVFERLLDRYFRGERDDKTLCLLDATREDA